MDKKLLASILEESTEGICVAVEGVIIHCSHSVYQMFQSSSGSSFEGVPQQALLQKLCFKNPNAILANPEKLSALINTVRVTHETFVEQPEIFTVYTEKGEQVQGSGKLKLLMHEGQCITLFYFSNLTDKINLNLMNQFIINLSSLGGAVTSRELMDHVLEKTEELTSSQVGFFHLVNEDQETITLTCWTKNTLIGCRSASDNHYPISKAGLWVNCFYTKEPQVVNDYATALDKKGMPSGHFPIKRFIAIPLFEGPKIAAIIGVGNKENDYVNYDVESLKFLATHGWNLIRRKQKEEELLKLNNYLEKRIEERTKDLERANIILSESEERYRLFISNSFEGIFRLEFETPISLNLSPKKLSDLIKSTGRIAECNDIYAQLLGFESRDEIVGRSLLQIFSIENPFLIQLVEHFIKYEFSFPPTQMVERREGFDSRFFTCSGFGTIENGKLLRVWGSQIEITSRIKIDEELQKLSKAIEQSFATVVITDPTGKIEYVNPKFCEQTGYTKEEVIGQNPKILNAGVFPREYYEQMWMTLKEGKAWQGELCNRTKYGEIFWEYASITSVKDSEGKISHYIGIKENINERKLLENQMKAAKELAESATLAKSNFMANMSHEIRTPMNAILGLNHLLSKTPLNEMQYDFVNKIEISAHHLLALINDILDFSKIEAGKLEIEQIPFDLEDILRDLADILEIRSQGKGLKLLFEIDENVPTQLIGDPLRIGQILLNLGSNAIKFTKQGEVKIKVEGSERDNKDFAISFIISDTGIGITKKQQEKLFNPFIQADATITRKYGGSGLGLSITKGLIDRMGGVIEVRSSRGQGSIFSVHLLLKKQSRRQKHHNYKIDRSNENLTYGALEKIKGAHILLVEDNVINQEVAKHILENAGMNVTVASDGKKAVDILQRKNTGNEIELVIMDLQMPIMDGYTATSMIRKTWNKNRLPIIAMSADVLPGVIKRVKDVGMNDYIAKPIVPALLFKMLVKWINVPEVVVNAKTESNRKPPELAVPKHSYDFSKFRYINSEDALSRVNQDASLFLEILTLFSKQNEKSIEKIVEKINNKEYIAAERFVHSLKGVSGNIGAISLYKACDALDSALLRSNQELADLQLFVAKVESELNFVLNEIRVFIDLNQSEPLIQQVHHTIIVEELLDKAVVLLKFLKSSNAKANVAFTEFKMVYPESQMPSEMKQLASHIDNYNYDAAILIVEKIIKKFKK